MVYFGIRPQSSTRLAAAPPLQATQERCLAIRCVPEFPGHNASTMPRRILVQTGVPQIPVPAESINGLAANAAETWTQSVGSLSVGNRRRAECGGQPSFASLTGPPGPAHRTPSSSG
jgi:hypothetical protein